MKKYKKGFTLIEVIIYIGLFAMLMTGALVSVYALIESQARNQTRAMVFQEGNFLLSKIEWAQEQPPEDQIVISLSGGNLIVERGGGEPQILNNENVQVICDILPGCFENTKQYLETNFTLTARTNTGRTYSHNFSSIKYE